MLTSWRNGVLVFNVCKICFLGMFVMEVLRSIVDEKEDESWILSFDLVLGCWGFLLLAFLFPFSKEVLHMLMKAAFNTVGSKVIDCC